MRISEENIGMTAKEILQTGFNPAYWDDWVHIMASPYEVFYNDEDDAGRGPMPDERLEKIKDNQLFFSGGGRLIKEV